MSLSTETDSFYIHIKDIRFTRCHGIKAIHLEVYCVEKEETFEEYEYYYYINLVTTKAFQLMECEIARVQILQGRSRYDTAKFIPRGQIDLEEVFEFLEEFWMMNRSRFKIGSL